MTKLAAFSVYIHLMLLAAMNYSLQSPCRHRRHSITVSHTPDERLKLRPSGVAGVGGDSQFNTEPTTGMYLKIPCGRLGD